jgi:hypothetical protein
LQIARKTTNEKRTSKIEARVREDLKIDLMRRCRELGVTESEFIHQIVRASLYGHNEFLTRLEQVPRNTVNENRAVAPK